MIMTRKMVPIKSKRVHSLYFVIKPGSSFHLCFLVVLLDERTISGMDLLEITWKGGIVVLCPYHGHLPDFLEDSQ